MGTKGEGPGASQCPPIADEGTFLLKVDATRETLNIYTYDGVMLHLDGRHAGFINVGCTKSLFITEILESSAGVCTFELFFIEDDGTFFGIVTAAATAQYNATGVFTFATITGGNGCLLGKNGFIDMNADRVI